MKHISLVVSVELILTNYRVMYEYNSKEMTFLFILDQMNTFIAMEQLEVDLRWKKNYQSLLAFIAASRIFILAWILCSYLSRLFVCPEPYSLYANFFSPFIFYCFDVSDVIICAIFPSHFDQSLL